MVDRVYFARRGGVPVNPAVNALIFTCCHPALAADEAERAFIAEQLDGHNP
jgi:predicted RNA polymerase sigma factor